ncbi:MAG TPA: hypothetical protein VFU39_01460 [Sulfuricaulis sp.]|jgi:hypothetical protein|nr:hypothetical protein [Gammaproteobacteria bacterium]MDH3405780.1 hypothetical protein [Gammaproteobacteria bacterium]MDH5488274.1 hypothetical protein [Gammaproteobacteria bacterium]HEU5337930.1 hypothetical protein [Sulfuricaulis sp.]
MPVKSWFVGFALALPLAAATADKPETPDMELIEFLGSLETQSDSGKEVLSAIDAGLLPEWPEEAPYDQTK